MPKQIVTKENQKEKARPKEPVGGPNKPGPVKYGQPANGQPGLKPKPTSPKFGGGKAK